MDTHEDFLGRIRYPGYHDKIMTAEKAAEFIKPEMTLGVSGFTIAGYPKAVAGELAKRARNGEKLELTVYSGASLGEEFDGELARAGALKARMPYQTNKDLRNSINAGMISYHDVPLGQMPVWVKNNFLKHIDVAIIEAAAIDENGNIIPTTSVGTSNIYAEYADKIIIEVNTYVPRCIEGIHDVYSDNQGKRQGRNYLHKVRPGKGSCGGREQHSGQRQDGFPGGRRVPQHGE